METYVPHGAPNEIFMALRRRSDDAALQTIYRVLVAIKLWQFYTPLSAIRLDIATLRAVCWPARSGSAQKLLGQARPGPMAFQNYRARPGPNRAAGPPGPCRALRYIQGFYTLLIYCSSEWVLSSYRLYRYIQSFYIYLFIVPMSEYLARPLHTKLRYLLIYCSSEWVAS